jgi:aminoglycoside phosphotransferase (APT) family kinase protein
MHAATSSGFTPPPVVVAPEAERVPWWRLWRKRRAAAPERGAPFLDELAGAVGRELGLSAGRLRIERVAVARNRSMTCILSDGAGPRCVARIPMNGRALGRCDENLSVLRRIHALNRVPSEIARVIPLAVGRLSVGGQPVFVETSVPGTSDVGRGPIRRRRARRHALAFLTALHASAGEPTLMDETLFEDRVGHYCDRLATAFDDPRAAATVGRLKGRLWTGLGGRSFPFVVEHGDFHLGNCLLEDGGRRLAGVIDWDLGACPGLPVLDALHLLVTSDGAGLLDAGTASRVLSGGLPAAAQALLSDYLEDVGIERDARPAWTLLYVLVKLLVPAITREGPSRDRWRETVALPTLETLEGSARP